MITTIQVLPAGGFGGSCALTRCQRMVVIMAMAMVIPILLLVLLVFSGDLLLLVFIALLVFITHKHILRFGFVTLVTKRCTLSPSHFRDLNTLVNRERKMSEKRQRSFRSELPDSRFGLSMSEDGALSMSDISLDVPTDVGILKKSGIPLLGNNLGSSTDQHLSETHLGNIF